MKQILNCYNCSSKLVPLKKKLNMFIMYPTILQNLKKLKCLILKKKDIDAFSDHTIGIGACLLAVSKREIYLEKYFSTSKALMFQQNLHIPAV